MLHGMVARFRRPVLLTTLFAGSHTVPTGADAEHDSTSAEACSELGRPAGSCDVVADDFVDDATGLLQVRHQSHASKSQAAHVHRAPGITGKGVPEQLRNTAACDEYSVDADQFRSGFPVSDDIFMPAYSSASLAESNGNIKRAVIFLHGFSGNANSFFCAGLEITKRHGLLDSTLAIAPWFGTEQVVGHDWSGDVPSDSRSVWWPTARWLSGGDSSPLYNESDGGNSSHLYDDSGNTLASYSVLDRIVENLVKAVGDGRFPNLDQITIAGFSAGCQLGSRWAFFSDKAAESMVQVVVASCGSWMYLNSTRPGPSCTVLEDTGDNFTCTEWGKPEDMLLDEYNQFKYGLTITERSLVHHSYLERFVDSYADQNAISAFPSKNVRFLLGNEDICNCQAEGYHNDLSVCFPKNASCTPSLYSHNNRSCCDCYPDALESNVLDHSDSGMVQGSNRLQRGLNYINFLRVFYADRGLHDYTPKYGIFHGGHDAAACFRSQLFSKWVYGIDVPDGASQVSWPWAEVAMPADSWLA